MVGLDASYTRILGQELEELRREVLYLATLALDFYEMGEKSVAQMVLREALQLARSRLQLRNNLAPGQGGLEAEELITLVHLLQASMEEGEDPQPLREIIREASRTGPR